MNRVGSFLCVYISKKHPEESLHNATAQGSNVFTILTIDIDSL